MKNNYHWILLGIATGIVIYLIDKYFGGMPAVFTLAVTERLFNTSVVYDDNDYRDIRKRLRDISIRLDRLEVIKQI